MISLLEMTDKAGAVYRPGTTIVALEDGYILCENADNSSEVIVWIPKEVRPYKYELRNMCDEEITDVGIKANLLWPEKLLYDSNDNQYCGYVTKKPTISGRLVPLSEIVERERCFDNIEKKNNVFIALQIARIYKAIRDTRHGYIIGIISLESFWVDEALNVYFLKSYSCACNINNVIKSYYVAPELLMYDSWKGKFTVDSDSFICALLLFQLLTGKFPYNSSESVEKTDVEYIWNLMCDGKSVFYNKTDTFAKTILAELNNYSEKISELFSRTFDYCGQVNYIAQRPMIDEWMEVLSEYVDNS